MLISCNWDGKINSTDKCFQSNCIRIILLSKESKYSNEKKYCIQFFSKIYTFLHFNVLGKIVDPKR